MITLSLVPSDEGLAELIGAMNSIGSGMGFRNTERALSQISSSVAWAWQKTVGSGHLIKKKKLTPFSHLVYTEDRVVHWIEEGLAPFDMRLTHPFGKKSRIVKPRYDSKGRPIRSWLQTRKDGNKYRVSAGDEYLIIPFRKSTTSDKRQTGQKNLKDVLSEVHKQMGSENFQRSKVITSPAKSNIATPNAMGEMVKRAKYKWGTRFQFPDTDEYKNLQGLVAMGPAKQSQFMNFRVVSVNSPNGTWQHPGIKARHNLTRIIENGQAQIRDVISEALRKDLS